MQDCLQQVSCEEIRQQHEAHWSAAVDDLSPAQPLNSYITVYAYFKKNYIIVKMIWNVTAAVVWNMSEGTVKLLAWSQINAGL